MEDLLKEDIYNLERGIANRAWKIDVTGKTIREELDVLKAKKAKEIFDVMATPYDYTGLELNDFLKRINEEYDLGISSFSPLILVVYLFIQKSHQEPHQQA